MAIGVVDIADILLFPDLVGDPDDVVDDVDILRLKTRQALLDQMVRRTADEGVRSTTAIGIERDRIIARHMFDRQRPEARPALLDIRPSLGRRRLLAGCNLLADNLCGLLVHRFLLVLHSYA
ncbi:hypothetical protein D9M72_628480 [compost metagenome]